MFLFWFRLRGGGQSQEVAVAVAVVVVVVVRVRVEVFAIVRQSNRFFFSSLFDQTRHAADSFPLPAAPSLESLRAIASPAANDQNNSPLEGEDPFSAPRPPRPRRRRGRGRERRRCGRRHRPAASLQRSRRGQGDGGRAVRPRGPGEQRGGPTGHALSVVGEAGEGHRAGRAKGFVERW